MASGMLRVGFAAITLGVGLVAGAPTQAASCAASGCVSPDPANFRSGCGNLSMPAVVHPGQRVTVGVTVSVGGLCGDAPAITISAAAAEGATYDGAPVAAGGWRGSWPGFSAPYPAPDSGTTFMLPAVAGSHTFSYRVAAKAKSSCVRIVGAQAVGPWAVLTGNGGTVGWSTDVPFRVVAGRGIDVAVADDGIPVVVNPAEVHTQVEVSGWGWRATGKTIKVYWRRHLIQVMDSKSDFEVPLQLDGFGPDCAGTLKVKQGSKSRTQRVQLPSSGVGSCVA